MSLPPPPPPPPSSPQGPRRPGNGPAGTPPPPSAGIPYGPPAGQKRARLALGYGIIGLIPFCGVIFAILAIVFGLSSQRASRGAGQDPFVMAKAGVVLGVVGIAVSVITLIVTLSTSR